MSLPITIGIVGNGFVGQATALFECYEIRTRIYDICPEKCVPLGTTLRDIVKCEFIFVCVPTPMKSLDCHETDTSIVEKVIHSVRSISSTACIIVRSTVPVGFCEKFRVHHMPEFLTEKNWREDFQECGLWVVGLCEFLSKEEKVSFQSKFTNFLLFAHSNKCIKNFSIKYTSTGVSELAKYARNTFLAVKVSFCNEIEELARAKGVDYKETAFILGADPRIGVSHTSVPCNGKRGWGGTCFPKDTLSLVNQIEKAGLKSYIIQAAISRNDSVDRSKKEDRQWEKNVGRTVSM